MLQICYNANDGADPSAKRSLEVQNEAAKANIQFNLKTEFSENISGDDDASIARGIVSTIEKKENDVQMDLEKVYDNFSDHYIKPLRRKLPVTGTKMNWNLHQVQYGKH